ncbi:MAG: hypothetical protein M3P43_13795, partial [Actinomycetota bacterium]|nr:hypothetical protein [Actinomycetota bacterium]
MDPVAGETWERPEPFAPGLTKVFGILVPRSGVNLPMRDVDDPRGDVALIPFSRGAIGLQFTVLFSAPDTFASSWPGANEMRTGMVGVFDIASG